MQFIDRGLVYIVICRDFLRPGQQPRSEGERLIAHMAVLGHRNGQMKPSANWVGMIARSVTTFYPKGL